MSSSPDPNNIEINSQPADTFSQTDLDTELLDNYNSNLLRERINYLNEKQNTERLSHGIESYVIEDAKVSNYFLQMIIFYKNFLFIFLEVFATNIWYSIFNEPWRGRSSVCICKLYTDASYFQDIYF